MENSIDLVRVKQIVSEVLSHHTINDIAFVGCGASSSELHPGFYFLKDAAKKLRAFHYTAAEFNTDTPQWLGENSVVIAASLGGGTPETVESIEVAKKAGATVISVTHAADSALTKQADYVIVHGFEKNYAAKLEKMGYVMAFAVEFCNQVEGYEYYDQMDLLAQNVEVVLPDGRVAVTGMLAGMDIWGRVTVLDAQGREHEIAPEQASVRPAS